MKTIDFQSIGLVNPTNMFKDAYQKHYAIPAFNFVCLEQLLAIGEACVETQSPVILQCSANVMQYFGKGIVGGLLTGWMNQISDMGSVAPMALNLDHGLTFDQCKDAINCGFSAVMIDGSMHSFEENIRLTRQVVEFAHDHNVSVEGELGALAGLEEEGSHDGKSQFTDPDQVNEFVQRTGVDCLAISIGTCHGVVKMKRNADGSIPELRFDILKHIEDLLPGFPIVMHGASSLPKKYVDMINQYGGKLEEAQGIPEKQIMRLLNTAVCKINNASDGWIAATAAARRALMENPGMIDPRGFLKESRAEMKKVYMRKTTDVFMSAHRKIV